MKSKRSQLISNSTREYQVGLNDLGNPKYRQVACMVDYFGLLNMICHVFTFQFKFDRLKKFENSFPNLLFIQTWIFHSTCSMLISLFNVYLFGISNHLLKEEWCIIVEYWHPISLNIQRVDSYCIEHFLNETTKHLLLWTELLVAIWKR